MGEDTRQVGDKWRQLPILSTSWSQLQGRALFVRWNHVREGMVMVVLQHSGKMIHAVITNILLPMWNLNLLQLVQWQFSQPAQAVRESEGGSKAKPKLSRLTAVPGRHLCFSWHGDLPGYSTCCCCRTVALHFVICSESAAFLLKIKDRQFSLGTAGQKAMWSSFGCKASVRIEKPEKAFEYIAVFIVLI